MITVQLEVNGPITWMDHRLLDFEYGFVDNAHEFTTWTEYYLPGKRDRPVHRSVHVHLKKGIGIEATLGRVGGG